MIEARTLLNLVAYVLQSTAVIVVALATLRLCRIDAPGLRYQALRVTLAVSLALPLLQPRVAAVSEPAGRSALLPPSTNGSSLARTDLAPARALPAPVPPSGWLSIVALLLGGGVAVRLLWLAAGLWRLQHLRRAGEVGLDVHHDLQDVIGTSAQLRFVEGLTQPVTFGWRHPIVLLPASLSRMSDQIQRAVIAHELWHVRRRDWMWMVAEETVRAALWFHPAIWALLSRVQLAREETVDDLAVLTTGSRRSYLDALLAFADARPILAVAAFARRRHLLHRMLMVSKESVMSPKRLVASFAVLLLAVGSAAWSAAAAFPLTGGQSPRDPTPAPRSETVVVPASEADLEAAIRREPKNPIHYQHLAQYFLKKGDFDRAVSTLESLAQADPSNPQHHHLIGVFYWEKAFRDTSLPLTQKMTYILSGIAAEDRALAIEPEFRDALIYKNILLRLQATHTIDLAAQQQLVAEADRLRKRAMELTQQQGGAIGPPDGTSPPPPPPPPPPVGPVDGMMPLRVGGTIAPPVKIRHVNPEYPELARANRVSGVVVIEAVINARGAVREARVLRSVPGLDQAAVDAVRQWMFTPTIVDGVARPVVMTVTVNFALQ